jgi:prephenate dehydrogenase
VRVVSRESRVESEETCDSRLTTHDSRLGTVAILGIGLIGGSLGMALRARGAAKEVIGWNRRAAGAALALERGAVDRTAQTPEEAVRKADLIVLGVPVEVTAPLARQIAPHRKPGAVVTDAGSAKARLVAEVEAILSGRFVGGHPMAGSEETGVAAASPDLFENAVWILTPTPQTDPSALETVARMAAAVGAIPRRCDPALHDRLVAGLSHLPHLLAYGLAQTAAGRVDDEWTDLAAGSFRDGTRVAKSDPALWTGILLDNRESVVEALDGFTEWAGKARVALETGDAGALAELLARAREARKRFP